MGLSCPGVSQSCVAVFDGGGANNYVQSYQGGSKFHVNYHFLFCIMLFYF